MLKFKIEYLPENDQVRYTISLDTRKWREKNDLFKIW